MVSRLEAEISAMQAEFAGRDEPIGAKRYGDRQE